MLLDGQTDDTSDAEDLAALKGAADGAPGDKEPDGPAVPPAPEPGKSVSVEAPKSRRARAEEERKAELSKMAQTIEDLRKRDEQRDRQFGELTGHLSALAQQRAAAPPVQQYQPPPPQLPDPDALLEQANAALDKRDMTGYHRLLLQANQAATMRAMAPVLQQAQQMRQAAPAQQQVPAELMAYFAAYPDVATHPSRDKLLMAKNAELEALGYQEGPARVKAVFDHVQATIKAGKGQQRQAPSFDQGSAAALAGTPTARPSGGSSGPGKGEPRVELTAEERRMWKAAGFTDEAELGRYVAQSNPSRVLR